MNYFYGLSNNNIKNYIEIVKFKDFSYYLNNNEYYYNYINYDFITTLSIFINLYLLYVIIRTSFEKYIIKNKLIKSNIYLLYLFVPPLFIFTLLYKTFIFLIKLSFHIFVKFIYTDHKYIIEFNMLDNTFIRINGN